MQSTAGPELAVLGAIPELVLVLVVAGGMARGIVDGMLWGLMGGLWLDLLSSGPFGVHMAALATVGFLAGVGSNTPFRAQMAPPLIAIVAATFLYDALSVLLLRLGGWPLTPQHMLRVAIPSALTNLFLMPVAYVVLSRLSARRNGQMSVEF